jgi:hypothetical protein
MSMALAYMSLLLLQANWSIDDPIVTVLGLGLLQLLESRKLTDLARLAGKQMLFTGSLA